MENLLYRRPRLLVLTLALIAVAGLSALEVLPRAEDPELVSRNALVVTAYPGADAERVETQVTDVLEEELEDVEEIHLLDSTSRAGVSVLSIELADAVTETAEVWSRVRDRLDDAAADLPAGAAEPEFDEVPISAWALHVALAWNAAPHSPADLGLLGRLAESLEDRLRAVPGTQEVESFGDPEEEIRVELDPTRLAARGLDVASLARALEQADAKVPSGRLDGARTRLLVEVAGELDGGTRIASVPLRLNADGSILHLGDVARVERVLEDPPSELARSHGRPAVLVAARAESGTRIDRWAERAHATLAAFEADLPGGVGLEVVYDQSTYTARRLEDLFGNLALGATLVVLVLLVTMGWRSALLVGSALPLSALMVFAGMRALDVPIHQMSVTGLIIALGLLIDNAIVMVDEVQHRLRHGSDVGRAVARAVRALAVPLLASTITTVLAFLPLVLAPGPVGEFVGAMSISVLLAVISSFLLALTVLPALAGFAHRVSERLAGRFAAGTSARWWTHGFTSPRLASAYRRTLHALLAQPVLAIVPAIALPVLGLWKGLSLQEQFFPPAGRDQAAIELTLPDSSSIARTHEAVERAEALLHAHPAVLSTSWVLGHSAPKFYYNQLEAVEGTPSFAGAMVQLANPEGARQAIRELQIALDRALPGAQVLVRQLEQGPPFDAPVELRLEGPDLAILRERGEALRAHLARVPSVTHTSASLEAGSPKLVLEPRDEDLERAGLDRVALARELEAALAGRLGGSVFEGDEELDVRVRLAPEHRDDAEGLAALAVLPHGTSTGERDTPRWLPLDALGELTLEPEAARITRRNGVRTNEVHAHLVAGTLPQDALDALTGALASFELPPGYRLAIGGEAQERDDAVGSLAASASVLVVLMVTTLVITFQSFRMTAILGGVALLSVGLSLGALWLFGHPFGFMAILGTLGLIGIAINDSIVVLAALRADARAMAGDVQAAVEVVARATRHVVSTTLTTVAGFLPLLLESEGLWPPLATSIAGGVVGATFLALLFVPGLFLWMRRRREPVAVAVPALA